LTTDKIRRILAPPLITQFFATAFQSAEDAKASSIVSASTTTLTTQTERLPGERRFRIFPQYLIGNLPKAQIANDRPSPR